MFFPSSSTTGYRPTTPHAPAAPTPIYTPPPRPRYTPPPKPAKKTGCFSGCIGLVVVFTVLSVFVRGCESMYDSDGSDSGGTDDTTVAETCPDRIAAALPDGDGAGLVQAYRTKNKQITLCRTTSGSLYYYGEFSDGREKGIAMEAEETSDGYEARNGEYRYVIHDGVVTVYQSGTQIGEEDVTPEPSPS
ncbi:hypothetical protein [Streptomyces regalis]|uniref:Uncharacterized protein n=1 Tax=Streptomyces regalis TaxID=68262 RepID=A0A0X3VFW6_9ACTN|nr:hypothetical protein [Streptomyces regalis]KUL43152.1 hypothetical protein ADL12_08200 [Streptomyces regalis]